MQSAGGLITTLRDMGTWLTAHINNGKVGGRQVLPEAAFEEAHRNGAGELTLRAQGGTQIGYGLGWNILVRGKDTIFTHGGGYPGFATHMSFVPARKLGIAIFANNDGLGSGLTELGSAMVYAALTNDSMALPIPADRIAALIAREKENVNEDLKRRAARPQTLSFPLDAYTGVYENPMFGKLRLSNVNGKLEASLGAAWSAVEVFDNTKNQLRIALFGNGEIVNVEMKDGKAVALSFGGNEYRRVN
jgi:CubicO group peptidase (beta-lactamase class C family)